MKGFNKRSPTFGDEFEFDVDLFEIIQEFVCILYGFSSLTNVNVARYKKFCSWKGKIPEPQMLLATSEELLHYCKRVSYVTAIVKLALEQNPDVPSPHGYGWEVDANRALEIVWMTQKPVPDSILDPVSCNCKKNKCRTENCVCVSHGLKCTDICGCSNCENEEMDDDETDEDGFEEASKDDECENLDE